ncbi:uncharacterized protein YegP (UPF0339 family) [Microbacterium phyllosphaerae]|uniref:Uncharacterized protein YegP (UPF0339 family) n=1 Tax=Microbacterium phyllosphaerae TaxID=124798 RepID=A0ABS4WKY2_9MICO|nr:DUF1508 domain-containing protein [Microbacterium phyllosphaerae]MBP2376855.1 uncharacterized protein YegP (UPF0339 family) [Microbacterium phyllosphaerae]
MTGAEATLFAAEVAAFVATAGLLWSVVSFFIVRRSQRATDAREQWSRRFEQAHALALSADSREAETGLLLIEKLSKDAWVTDEDRATAVTVLTSLAPTADSDTARVRESLLGSITDRAVARELTAAPAGPKAKFEVYTDRSGEHRWRLKFANGQVAAVSEGFASRQAVLRNIGSVRQQLQGGGGEIREVG